VSTNGFLSFNNAITSSSGSNSPIPTSSSPNSVIAPYWEDLENVKICQKADAANHTVTFQWTGNLFGDTPTAEMQVVLHSDTNNIEFVYGSHHTLDGSQIPLFGSDGATVGIENATGTTGLQVLYDQAALTPSSSFVFTAH
jgi:hypothetical protein